MQSKKQSGKNNKNGQKFNLGRVFAVFLFVLVFASGLAMTQTANAAWPPPNPVTVCDGKAVGASCNGATEGFCTAASLCRNEDVIEGVCRNTRGDGSVGCFATPATCVISDEGYFSAGTVWCKTPNRCLDKDQDRITECQSLSGEAGPPPDFPPGGKYSANSFPNDCDDNDPWSHRYASANIQSISVDFEPDYVAWAKSVRNYTPKTPYSLRDTIKATVTFKKKCGLKIPTPNSIPMNISIVRGDGVEIPISIFGGLGRKMDFVYQRVVNLNSFMTEETIASIAKNPNWQLKLVGPGLTPDISDTPKYALLPMTNHIKKLIIGGLGAPARHKIFSTIGSLAPGSIKIPLRLKSVARNTVKIREEINKQLNEGNEVLVIGHSLGAVMAYNLQKEFTAANKCVSGVYIDPPYNFLPCKMPLVNLMPYIRDIRKAACDGIASDSSIVDWTNGHGLGHFFSHDPFTFPNHIGSDGRRGYQKVEDLIKVVKGRLGDSFSYCSFGSVPPPTSLKTTPQITGVLSSGRPITSVRPGDSVTITGSGFSPTGNIVDIQNATYAQVYYELFNLPSSNGTTLTFVLPPSPVPPIKTVPGAYFLKVSAVNSDWSKAVTVQVVK